MLGCCRKSEGRGVRPGMPLSEAMSLVPRALLMPHDTEADAAVLSELAVRCGKFSPLVGIEEGTAPESLLLDVTGLEHRFGSEEELARQIVRELSEQSYIVHAAVADTLGAAWAAAHFLAVQQRPVVLPPGRTEVLCDLPIEGLRLSRQTVDRLRQLGLSRIGEVIRLPRSSLKARFGEEVLRRVDQLTGRREELITPQRPAPEFRERWDFEHSTMNGEAIEQVLSHLLERLLVEVTQQQGIVELTCSFEMENNRSLSVPVGLYQPSISPQYLLELIGLQLEQKRFSQPVSGIIVEATVTAPLAWKQSELFDSDKRQDSQKLGSLIDRLSSRLGRAAVVRPQLRAEAVPERAWLDVPLSGKGRTRRDNRSRFAPFERPLTLLPTPLPVNVIVTVPEGLPVRLVIESTQHDIIRLWGPERIETAWWRGPSVQRDYYRVKTITGQRFWLFRRLQDGRWFLHGEFD